MVGIATFFAPVRFLLVLSWGAPGFAQNPGGYLRFGIAVEVVGVYLPTVIAIGIFLPFSYHARR